MGRPTKVVITLIIINNNNFLLQYYLSDLTYFTAASVSTGIRSRLHRCGKFVVLQHILTTLRHI